MLKTIRLCLLPLLLLAVIALFSAYGCSSPKPSVAWQGTSVENMSQPQLQQMLSDSIVNNNKLNSYKFDLDSNAITSVTGGQNPWKMVLDTAVSGGENIATRQTHLIMAMTYSYSEIASANVGSETLTYDVYGIQDMMYMKMTIPGIIDKWIKVSMSSKMENTFYFNTVDEQMGPLNEPAKITYLKTEKVNGIDCYVLVVTPSTDELAQWLSEQNTSAGKNLDWQNLVKNTAAIKSFSLTAYITKDSNLLTRMVVTTSMEITPAEAGNNPADYDIMQLSINTDMKLSDQNQPYSVTLPSDAASATLVSEDIFSSVQ